MSCSWITKDGKKCTNNILMDNYCSKHLKQTCSICFEKVPSTNSAQCKRLRCGHAYHFNCILNWFVTSDQCPVCRQSQQKDDLILFKNKIEDEMREKYRDVMATYEYELRRRRRR